MENSSKIVIVSNTHWVDSEYDEALSVRKLFYEVNVGKHI